MHDRFWLIVASLCVVVGNNTEKPLEILTFDKKSLYGVDCRSGVITVKVFTESGFPKTILTADLTQCKAVVTFKQERANINICRFCDHLLDDKTRAEFKDDEMKQCEVLNNVCNNEVCLEAASNVCRKRLACGHLCNGIKDEKTCLPCLEPDCDGHTEDMKEDRDTYCNICYTDTLSAQPTILLESCRHAFHYKCVYRMLQIKWNGPRITFGFRGCPLCKKDVRHPGLATLNDPLDKLFESVKRKALTRLKYEKLEDDPHITSPNSKFYNDPVRFAMDKYAYYLCYKCNEPYYGGEGICVVAQGARNFDPSELLCPSCSPIRVEDCPKHGKDFIEFKCRYCCSIAVWFCFGTTHFCEPCHSNNGQLTNKKKEDLVQCPCRPKDRYGLPEKLKDIVECPLSVKHPPHGEEFCLGCGLCRNKDF